MENITEGLWRWTARHPEWHPGGFGDEVAAFAADAGDGTLLLIDPLLPPDPEPVLDVLDERAGASTRVAILISIPYHVRSSEKLWKRYRKGHEVTIHGHRACAKRLNDTSAFHEIDPAVPLPAGVTAHAIGKPRRHETPLHVPSHGALVFGDAVAETDGRLVMWAADKVDTKVDRFYRERFAPTLEPLLELDFDRVLVTHGQPVMKNGKKALADGLRAKPWYHHG
jgi:alkanesulfonate monooxygenase SsuD/methylene tetrahydromethanopterin reductase-like flavin-dependent oxidoreductase (luciferase family)